MKYLFNVLVFLLLLSFSANATTIYVKKLATGSNNGTSWTNAYTDLQDALDAASVNDQIWVATGTYLPTASPDGTTTDNRNNAFHLATDMKIYGGFDGTETLLSARDAATNSTILSGDFSGDDDVTGSGSTFAITGNTENAYHVMITANLTVAAVIDGFTIKGGNANGGGNINYQLQAFSKNSGGGMRNISSLTITNTTFSYNTANYGGGMYNTSPSSTITSPTITNTTFSYNTAVKAVTFGHGGGGFGGGMANSSSSPTITNTTFSYNTAEDEGGGMLNYDCSVIIKNSIFWENLRNSLNNVSGADIQNFSSSPTVTYCLTQANSVYDGVNNSEAGIINNQNPLFVDAANGDFSLQGCSPAINTGTATNAPTTDILGNPRVGTVDMGAYEYQGILSAPTVTQPTCTTPTGTIIVNATTSTGTLEYSIDNGITYQTTNTFSGLAVGNYTIKVNEQNSSCTETYSRNPVVINAFIITVSAPTVTQPTCTTPTGTIIVNATTSTGTLEYSIDNGITYQATNTFSGLTVGSYTIKVNEQNSSCTETYGSNPVVINALINYNTQIYVKTGATAGSNDGSSWENAFLNLQDAIDANCNGVDIWVAAGTYLPTDAPDGTTTDNRNNAFHLATDMKIYGGFDGTETLLSARDAATNSTILSGDFSGDDGVTGSGSTFAITGNTENAYHVMITANLTVAAVIDGFTIKGGNANGNGSINYQLQAFSKNSGGGMRNISSLTITNTTLSYNTANYGGGMYNASPSSPPNNYLPNNYEYDLFIQYGC